MSSNQPQSICFDASRFRPFKGNSVYVLSLIQELARHEHFTNLTLLASAQNNEFFSPLGELSHVSVKLQSPRVGGRIFAHAEGADFDLYHRPGGQEPLIEVGARQKPHVFTFHDANYLQGRGGALWKRYKILSTIAMAERAAGIVFISQFARDEFCRIKRLAKCLDRVPHRVIWNGCGFPDRGARAGRVDGPWVCFANQKHKRSDIAIAAFTEYCQRSGANDRLVVIGNNAQPGCSNRSVEFRSNLSFQELVATVRSAKGLLFPSEYEGFGLPVLEAAISGVPVISNDLPAVREIFDATISYASNNDVVEYVEWMEKHRHSEALIESMTQAAWQRARKISWRRCADDVVDFYKEVSQNFYNL